MAKPNSNNNKKIKEEVKKEDVVVEEVKTGEDVVEEKVIIEEPDAHAAYHTLEQKLMISEAVSFLVPEGERLVIKNTSGGELFVGNGTLDVREYTLLTKGCEKEFVGEDVVYAISASRPIILASFFK